MPIVDRRKKGEAVTQKGASAIDRPTDGRTEGRRGAMQVGRKTGAKKEGRGSLDLVLLRCVRPTVHLRHGLLLTLPLLRVRTYACCAYADARSSVVDSRARKKSRRAALLPPDGMYRVPRSKTGRKMFVAKLFLQSFPFQKRIISREN